jgi:hypothetical protein
MAQEIIPSSSPSLEEVKEQFAKWRQNRKVKEPIPDELWQAAVGLTSEYSVSKIAKTLNLTHSDFKKRMIEVQNNEPAFVEFQFPTPATASTHWVLEMDKPGGAKMRISCQNASLPNLLEMGKVFWGSSQ